MFTFELPASSRTPPGPHSHTLELSQADVNDLIDGKSLTVITSEVAGHEHEVVLAIRRGSGKQIR